MRGLHDTFDVELVVDGGLFHAHRCVLAVMSPILHKMFTNGMRESSEFKVTIKEVKSNTSKAVMDYIY